MLLSRLSTSTMLILPPDTTQSNSQALQSASCLMRIIINSTWGKIMLSEPSIAPWNFPLAVLPPWSKNQNNPLKHPISPRLRVISLSPKNLKIFPNKRKVSPHLRSRSNQSSENQTSRIQSNPHTSPPRTPGRLRKPTRFKSSSSSTQSTPINSPSTELSTKSSSITSAIS